MQISLYTKNDQAQMSVNRTRERLLKREKLSSDLQVIQGSNKAESFGATSGGSQHTFGPEPGALHQ